MNDEEIIRLYFDRNEQAITESSAKYGTYCSAIAGNILSDVEDVKECVNDTWLRAWNSIPPARPSILQAFLGRITRNLSFDRYRSSHRKKRSDGKVNLVLDELQDIVSGHDDPESTALEKELIREINSFLSPEELVDVADKALYVSKNKGRNQITFAFPALMAALDSEQSAED